MRTATAVAPALVIVLGLGVSGEVGSPLRDGYQTGAPGIVGHGLAYSTFLGADGYNQAHAVAVDRDGFAYVASYSSSRRFPTTPGAFDRSLNGAHDVVVSKIARDGSSLVYSTFLGGTGEESPAGVAVDGAGNAYVIGSTQSVDFPVTAAYDPTPNGGSDAFVAKISPDGSSLVYSTFLGGASSDYGAALALDGSGGVLATGYGLSDDFPTTPGAFDTEHGDSDDVFVARFTPDGSDLVYSTLLGGNQADHGFSIAVDGSGRAFVGGSTSSGVNFPTTPGAFDTTYNGSGDAFVTELGSDGSQLVYSTLLGGDDNEWIGGIALDPSGAAYVTGDTESSDFPTTPGAFDTSHQGVDNAFVTRLSADGSSLGYSTFLGVGLSGTDIEVPRAGGVVVLGGTFDGFPTTPNAFDTTHNGYLDLFLTWLSADGSSLLYSTYLGGKNYDYAYQLALDERGDAYTVGRTYGRDYPTTPGAFQPVFGGTEDGILTKIDLGRG